jgi:hypothetical protein
VIDRVLQLLMICAVVDGDCLPCSVSYHTSPVEDLHDCLVLFSSRAWNSLDSELRRSGDVDAVQQIPQSASGIRDSFPAVLISSTSWYIFSFLESLKGV